MEFIKDKHIRTATKTGKIIDSSTIDDDSCKKSSNPFNLRSVLSPILINKYDSPTKYSVYCTSRNRLKVFGILSFYVIVIILLIYILNTPRLNSDEKLGFQIGLILFMLSPLILYFGWEIYDKFEMENKDAKLARVNQVDELEKQLEMYKKKIENKK